MNPTVGRQVHFITKGRRPLAATICYVHSDTMVNLDVIDENGNHFAKTSVQLLQQGELAPDHDHCIWPVKVESEVQKAARKGYNDLHKD